MSCEKYQNLISESIDGNIESQSSHDLVAHLSVCAECAKINEDFLAISNFYDEGFMEDSIPPNSQALWCRINNIIETEVQSELLEEEAKAAPKQSAVRKAWTSSWKFSPLQMATSALGIALVSSLLTIVGIRNFTDPNHGLSEAELKPNFFEQTMAKFGLFETEQQSYERRIKARKSTIAYWEKRVELQRKQWDTHFQNAFDRNLLEINKAVNEYTNILQENPQDKISTEMLNSALDEKMEFLREFSEL